MSKDNQGWDKIKELLFAYLVLTPLSQSFSSMNNDFHDAHVQAYEKYTTEFDMRIW